MTRVRNWAGNVTFAAERLHRPRTVDELCAIVAAARSVRALGTGHSFNRIVDTAGDLVTVADLDVPLEIGAGVVTVGGGVRYGALAVALDARGLALHNLGSLPHISVAGACATGTHGSGSSNRCLPSAAVRIEFVQADGTLISMPADDPAFGGSVLALGALGVVTRLTLAVEPAYEVRQDVWLHAAMPAVLNQLDEIMTSGYSVSLFTTFARPGVLDQIWVKSRVGTPVFDGRSVGAVATSAAMHPIAGQDGSSATAQFGVPGPWHERLPHFRLEFTPSNGDEQQSEYLLPRSSGAAALETIQALDLSAALQICEVRTIAADDLWLSPFRGRDTLALHFTWVDDDALVAAAVDAVEAALAPFDPRPHWGKVFRAAPTWHRPALAEFRALLDRHDPDRKFGNAFLAEHIY